MAPSNERGVGNNDPYRTHRQSLNTGINETGDVDLQSKNPNFNSNTRTPKSYENIIASWTIVLGMSTVALVAATTISAYFLWATDQTIKTQVDTARIQLRAYVGMNQFLYMPIIKKDTDKPDVFAGSNLGITWKNFGSTPAKEFEYWLSAKWLPTGNEPDFSIPAEKLSEHTAFNIGPGLEISGGPVFVSADDIQKTNSGNGHVFIWGHAAYRDYFPDSPRHQFNFCLIGTVLSSAPGSGAAKVYKSECNYSD